jgi:hypothetical protein
VSRVGSEFVVATAEVLDERMSDGDSCGRPEAFNSAHCGRDHVLQHPQVLGSLVRGHINWRRPAGECSDEEPASGGGVPLLGQQHVYDLHVLVDRPVQVPPPAGTFT